MPEMNFEAFKNWAYESIKFYLPDTYRDAEVEIRDVVRTGNEYTALLVRKDQQRAVPAVNLEKEYELYDDGAPLQIVAMHMAEIVQQEAPEYDLSMFSSYDSIKKNLFIRVCNARDNYEILEDVPHTRVENLAITYHVMVRMGDEGMSSSLITNSILDSFGIDKEQLHKDALANSEKILPVKIDSMFNIMSGMTGIDMDSMGVHDNPSMIVITNNSAINGASALFYEGTMQKVSEQLHGDYYILPSSIHEVIAIPTSMESDYRNLERMVHDVNSAMVEKEDQLSDRVYRYDSKSHTFELAAAQATRARREQHRRKEVAR